MNTWADLETTWALVGNTWQSIFLPPVPANTSNFTVELGLQKAFLLDDEVAGVIGGTEYVLNGEEFVDITPFAYSISTSRGKNTELDKFKSGSVTVSLRNDNRYFDPRYSESPFSGQLVPRRGMRITANSVPVFTGRVTDWDLEFSPGNESNAIVEAVDNFSLLATQTTTAGTVAEQYTGQRVAAILDMASVDWPANDRRLDTGLSTVGSAVLTGDENALQYLQEVELSEIGGSLFISREGYLIFRDRQASTLTDPVTTFADDGSGIPFSSISVDYGSENLFNQITVTSPAGTATADRPLSQSQYGISAKSFDTFLSSQEQLDAAATFLVTRYSQPILRFKSMTIEMEKLTQAQKDSVLGLEIAEVASITYTPQGIGDPIEDDALIIGISHNIAPNSHVVTLDFGPIQSGVFIIGDAEFGIIGVDAPGVLGF